MKIEVQLKILHASRSVSVFCAKYPNITPSKNIHLNTKASVTRTMYMEGEALCDGRRIHIGPMIIMLLPSQFSIGSHAAASQ